MPNKIRKISGCSTIILGHIFIVVCLIVLTLIIIFTSDGGWNYKTDTSWYNESQQEFTITTAEQLAGLSKLVYFSNDFQGKTINLGANIMFNDTANWKNWGEKPPKKKWVPIGYNIRYKDSFKGNFNGNGYVISGIYTDSDEPSQGLFGYTEDGLIENLGVIASYIKGDRVGGLVGKNAATINNCYFIGTVIGTREDMGGLVGYNSGTINNSYSSGKVFGRGKYYTGGLVGSNSGTISNSHSTCDVRGVYSVGGLTGSNDGTIKDSYFLGLINGVMTSE